MGFGNKEFSSAGSLKKSDLIKVVQKLNVLSLKS